MIYHGVFCVFVVVNHSWLWWSLNVPDRFSACKECGWIWLHLLSSAVYLFIDILLMAAPSRWLSTSGILLRPVSGMPVTDYLALGLLVSLNEAFPELHCSLILQLSNLPFLTKWETM